MIYFSSDLHFNHNKEFIYKPRGFTNVDDMNNTIIQNFNSIITYNDDLYLLGDTMLGDLNDSLKLFHQLPGRIHLIWGNHCTNNRKQALAQCDNVVEIIGFATIIKYNKYHFYLSHFPTLTTNYDLDKPLTQRILCLAGHTHSKELFEPCGSYNVAVDAHNCFPVSIEQIISDFKRRYSI